MARKVFPKNTIDTFIENIKRELGPKRSGAQIAREFFDDLYERQLVGPDDVVTFTVRIAGSSAMIENYERAA
jgi:hypothetical protein